MNAAFPPNKRDITAIRGKTLPDKSGPGNISSQHGNPPFY